ncbi:unnamed protein product [Jaminaea pallidilutea]
MAIKLKKLKRPTAKKGDAAGSGRPAKKQRGPKRYIEAPNAANGKVSNEHDVDEDDLQEALEAEEMAGEGSDDSDDSNDDDNQVNAGYDVKGKGKAKDADLGFLLKLDQKGISRSRAEEARLKKAERRAQNQESGIYSRGHAPDDAEDSDGGSTDMEGASEGSSAGSGGDDDDISILDSEEEFDSQDAFSDEEDSEEEDEDTRTERVEHAHQERIKARERRQKLEEREAMQNGKGKRLPVRGQAGTWQEGSADASSDDEEGKKEAATRSSRRDKDRALHSLRLADADDSEGEEESENEIASRRQVIEPPSTITSGARFGLQAPYSIMQLKPKSARIAAAKEQIARLSTDIIGDPEVSLGLLRRLNVFVRETIKRPEHDSMAREKKLPEEVEVDQPIRAAALMSLTAVYIDILPGYRIRPLTDKESSEKVNQETARRREWEQGIVQVYKEHLQNCEQVARSKTPAASVALRSMCVLMTRATHFNFRTNLISSLVSQLSRRSWSPDSQQCAEALTECLQRDLTGEVSLEVVRLLNRMIKERRYQVNPKVLNLLLHLRLKDELGSKRADTTQADRNQDGRDKIGKGKAKPKEVRKGQGQHLSKKQVKKMREIKEVERDMKEAEAEIDKEERDRNHTETLKLLFVLYFSILKADEAPGPLLGAGLEGLSRFAHRVNVDFFRDLLAVLRAHIESAREGAEEGLVDEDGAPAGHEALAPEAEAKRQESLRKALLCLVTAFELLSGQGEALDFDMSDLVGHLYAIMVPLCTAPGVEEIPQQHQQQHQQDDLRAAPFASSKTARFQSNTHLLRTSSDLLLRALDLTLLRPRLSSLPSERSAAFIKRLLSCALHTPAQTSLRLLGVVRSMIGKDPRLEALLDTEDRAKNGTFDPSSDALDTLRPLGAGEVAWELHLLSTSVNEDVAAAAKGILLWKR